MATPELTYGGFPLGTDVDRGVGSFMDRHLNTEDLRDIAPAIARVGSRADGLAWPNYPAPPLIRPNQLYWPTGASRWAIGYFYADDENKDKIVAAAHSSTNTALELRVVQNETFTTKLFLLTPRKVSCVDKGNNVWLLPLVDERYFWQFRDIGSFAVTTSSTWADMFTQLGTQLGVSIDDETADTKYLIPDPEELTRRYDNAAVLLDAVAHSVGQRIVRWPDGSVKSMNWATSATQLTTNIESKTPWQQIAGGESDFGPVPASVNVVCRRFVDHVAIPRKVHIYNEAASAHLTSPATTSGTIKTIHTYAYADFTLPSPADQPNNDTDLDNLAEQIASDFYDSTKHAYDRTFAGIKLWDSCGYDDHILYQFGGEYPVPNEEGEYEKWAHTRVQSSPVNFGVEHQLSQDDQSGTLVVLAPQQFGVLDGTLADPGQATCSIHENNNSADRTQTGHGDSDVNVEVFNFLGGSLDSGSSGNVEFDFESEKWYFIPRAVGFPPIGQQINIFRGTVVAGTNGTGSSAWTLDAVAGVGGYDTVKVTRTSTGATEYTIQLPHVGIFGGRVGPAPNLRVGNKLMFSGVNEGGLTIVSGYLDDALGTIKIWDGTAATIPFGWEEHEPMRAFMPVHVDTSLNGSPGLPTADSVGVTDAGQWTHAGHDGGTAPGLGHDTHDHTIDNHPDVAHDLGDSGGPDFDTDGPDDRYQDHELSTHVGGVAPGLGHDTSDHILDDEDHWPPLYPVFFIKRIHE